MRHRYHARGDHRGRAAARSARGALGVPGVVRGAIENRLRRRVVAELGRRAHAGGDDPRGTEALHEFGVVAGDQCFGQRAAAARWRAPGLHAEFLEEQRHAAERPVGQSARDLGTGQVVDPCGDGVERAVYRIDAGEGVVEQFRGRHFAFAHELRQPQAIVIRIPVHVRHDSLPLAAVSFKQAYAGRARTRKPVSAALRARRWRSRYPRSAVPPCVAAVRF